MPNSDALTVLAPAAERTISLRGARIELEKVDKQYKALPESEQYIRSYSLRDRRKELQDQIERIPGHRLQRLGPGKRQAFGHRHNIDEEVYVVLSGSGRMRLADETVEIGPWDAIRVAPSRVSSRSMIELLRSA